MTVRWLPPIALLVVVLTACGRLGIGEQTCEPHARVPSGANILSAQAVPTAKYTPCFSSLDIGWDDVDFEAESGRAGIAIERGSKPFLTAVVTASCDVGDAIRVESGYADIDKYEDVEVVPGPISVMVIPAGADELGHAAALISAWEGVELDERPVLFTLDEATERPIAARVEDGFDSNGFVWVIDELDAAENTVEMRTVGGGAFAQMQVSDALDEIEDLAPTARYLGKWFFTFEGGCITYTFEAEGLLAETVAADATANLGFYPAYELWDIARRESRLEELEDD